MYCGVGYLAERSDDLLDDTDIADRRSGLDCEDAARIPLTEEAVLDLLRQHFVDADAFFVCPHVPQQKEHAARRAHAVHLSSRERILALYDGSAFTSSGDEGFIVTTRRICWKNPGEEARTMQWRDLDPEHLYVDGPRLFLGEQAILLPEPEVQDACANAFHVLALSGLPSQPIASARIPAHDASADREAESRLESSATFDDPMRLRESAPHRRGMPPLPAPTTSYFAYASHAETQMPDCSCWHCHTPLYETTPRCAFCGVEPTSTGWLRTG